MCNNEKAVIRIGNKDFIDVTNETVAMETFSWREAQVWGYENRRVACSN